MNWTAISYALVVLIFLTLSGSYSADARPSQRYRSRKLVSSDDFLNGQTSSASSEVLPGRFLVKLRSSSNRVAGRKSGPSLDSAQSIVDTLRKQRVEVRVVQKYEVAFKGFSLETDDIDATLEALDEANGVLSVYPVVLIPPPEAANIMRIDPATLFGDYAANSSATGSVSTTLASLGFPRLSGADVRVAVIDTGVDPMHPAFRNAGGTRIAFRRGFVPDNYVAGGIPEESDNVNDCMGHGTHVAGIIAGSFSSSRFSYSGIAPGVTLGAYKVFGCNGSTTNEVIIAALDKAAKDQMQIINLSIGIPGTWGGLVAAAVDQLAQRGVLVVSSVGNEGASGLFLPTSIANTAAAIAVGSTDSAAVPSVVRMRITSSNGVDYVLYTRAAYGNLGGLANAPLQPFPATVTGCQAAELGDLSGTVAMLTAAGCDATVKAANAALAGAVGVVLYGDTAALGSLVRVPYSWPLPSFSVPVLAVTLDAATTLPPVTDGSRSEEVDLVPNEPEPAIAPPLDQPPPSLQPPSQPDPQDNQPPSQPQANYPPPSQPQANYQPPSQPQANYPPPSQPQPNYQPPSQPQAIYPPPSQPQANYPPPSQPQANYPLPSQPQANYPPPSQPHADYPPPSQPQANYPPSTPSIPSPTESNTASSAHLSDAVNSEILSEAATSGSDSDGDVTGGVRRRGRRLTQDWQQLTIVEISGSPVSASSSWGPGPDLRMKPSVMAPGGLVLGPAPGTVPGSTSSGYFAYRSGTSQSAPYVSGALALLLEAGRIRNQAITAAQVARALSITSRPVFDRNASSAALSASPANSPIPSPAPAATTSALRVGSGSVDIAGLLTNRFDVSPAQIELGSNLTFGSSFSVWLDVSMDRTGLQPVLLQFGHQAAASISSSDLMVVNKAPVGPFNNRSAAPFDPVYSPVTASVTFASSRVSNIANMTVPAGGNIRLRVTFTLPSPRSSQPAPIFFSGYIILRPVSSPDPNTPTQAPLTVPYLGFSSSFSSLPVLVTAGISTSNGGWLWDDRPTLDDGIKGSAVVAPPPRPLPPPPPSVDWIFGLDAYDTFPPPAEYEPPSPPRALPVSPGLTFRRDSMLPSLALFIQRPTAGRDIQLWRASEWVGTGVKMGTIRIAGGTLPRVSNDGPLIINWDGRYFDDSSPTRGFNVPPGKYFIVVRLTRGSALSVQEATSTVDVWQSPLFELV
ncbi:hypothetical protein VOLCADRAFT_92090 [Volvox carteri f. nagariensis]|uniref:Peptidase S8/S53 domain-containing protein n=1 Tax=Volvox carteri f. nagariensis TaxID=3068 RepID=D8TYK3_VOLCA|nr:uncharacterized protein VOLCADRAFT_92090 [Volvox carteri f. nagariensis]EFJ47326.1 hypothetical protein VOLCADRAFT_92090 [Volvox carteri f. nagariensis]|eukprot:XP_002951515.1 hypothetical protein VOLCADRAFT_92090 [Volvox carteri f. nagariensis]